MLSHHYTFTLAPVSALVTRNSGFVYVCVRERERQGHKRLCGSVCVCDMVIKGSFYPGPSPLYSVGLLSKK